jgi:hypothetical protein
MGAKKKEEKINQSMGTYFILLQASLASVFFCRGPSRRCALSTRPPLSKMDGDDGFVFHFQSACVWWVGF